MKSSHFIRGTQLFKLNRYKEAAVLFKDALQEDPENIDTKHYLALCYYQLDDLDTAEKLVQSLLSSAPNFSDAHYLYSVLLFQKDKEKLAFKHIDEAIRLMPYQAEYFGQKSLMLTHKKHFDEALEMANNGLAIDAQNLLCLNARTKALTKLNRKEDAFNTIETSLQEDPENNFTHANIGWTNLEIGNHKKALEHFKESLKIDPNYEYARQGMVQAIKAKNIIYRSFLKYSFWIQNKSKKNQWFFIIGIYVAYRFSYKLLEGSSLSYIAPFLALLYLLFALGSWIITPMSNGILLFNNYGKYLLDKNDKQSGLAFIILATIALISILLFYSLTINLFLVISLVSLVTIIPLTYSLQLLNKKSRIFGLSYSLLMLLIGFIGIFVFKDITLPIAIPFVMMVLFTWFSGLLKQ